MHYLIVFAVILIFFCVVFTIALCQASRNWRSDEYDYELDNDKLDEKDPDTKNKESR